MKLRFYAAVVTGVLADIITCLALWCCTSMSLPGIAFASLIAYLIAIYAVMVATEPPKRKRRPIGKPTVITLKKENWAA